VKEIKKTRIQIRMLAEAVDESLANYLAYSMKQCSPMTRAMVRKLVINIIKEDPRRNTL
jgi:hypothetical protein